mgnify:CR=1 FL=1
MLILGGFNKISYWYGLKFSHIFDSRKKAVFIVIKFIVIFIAQ